jgi:hypothetical protein
LTLAHFDKRIAEGVGMTKATKAVDLFHVGVAVKVTVAQIRSALEQAGIAVEDVRAAGTMMLRDPGPSTKESDLRATEAPDGLGR